MDSFWSYVLAALAAVADYVMAGIFPPHTNLGLTGALTSIASDWLTMMVMMLYSYVNLTVPILVAVIIGLAEGVRAAYSIWRIILKAIPMAG